MENRRGETRRVAAQKDVGAAAGHVRGDCDRAGPARLGHDRGFLLVELGVEDLVLDAAASQHLGQQLGFLYRHRADQDWPPLLVHLDDLVDEGGELAVLVAED